MQCPILTDESIIFRLILSFSFEQIVIDLAIWAYGAVLFVSSQSSRILGYSSAEDQVNLLLGGDIQRLADDPNIFFAVWISVVTVILLVTNICKASLITTDWLLLAIASVALLVASAEYIFTQNGAAITFTSIQPCDAEKSNTCRRFFSAFYLAIVSLCLSLLMALLSRFRIWPILHVVFSVPLVIAWGLGVLYITFLNSRATPASVYFAFWGGIFLALEISSINIIIIRRNKRKKDEEALAENESEDEGFLSAIMKDDSLSVIESTDFDFEIPTPSNGAKNTRTLQQGSSDVNGSVQSKCSSSQENEISTTEKNKSEPEQPFSESLLFEKNTRQEDAKSMVTKMIDPSQTLQLESNRSGIELHSAEGSKATSSDLFDTDEHSSDRKQNYMKPTGGPSLMPILSVASSVDTNDFEDCLEFESSRFSTIRTSSEIHSSRSSEQFYSAQTFEEEEFDSTRRSKTDSY